MMQSWKVILSIFRFLVADQVSTLNNRLQPSLLIIINHKDYLKALLSLNLHKMTSN